MSENPIKQVNLEIDLENAKKENANLKEKLNELRANNNSFIYTALVKTQAEMPIIYKNASSFGKQRYADLAEIIRISRPILVKNGLCITQTFNDDKLITTLCHTSGQCISSSLKMTIAEPKGTDTRVNILQTTGCVITYLRRYSYSSIVGIATDDDTDGN